MPKRTQKNSQPNFSSRDELLKLDKQDIIGLLLKVLDQNAKLSEIMHAAMFDRYGTKTERFSNPDQLNLFQETSTETQTSSAEVSNHQTSENSPAPDREKSKPAKKATSRQVNPRHALLERERIPMDSDHITDLSCACCGADKVKIGETVLKSRLEFRSSQIILQEFFASILGCQSCNELPKPVLTKKTAPELGAGPKLIAQIAVSKFQDHLPLFRQQGIFNRIGADIPRSTMVGWLAQNAKNLRPLYDFIHQKLLDSKVIKTDDTTVKTLDRSKKNNIKRCNMWVYIGDESAPYNIFDFTEGRGRAGPVEFLLDYKGFLQGDCFSGNLALCASSGATFVACWAHARRYFFKAHCSGDASAAIALDLIKRLYEIESTAKELRLSAEQLHLMREQESIPILKTLFDWMQKQSLIALPQSRLGKAINYTLNNWQFLLNYTLSGILEIDNNTSD
jgi:transposase